MIKPSIKTYLLCNLLISIVIVLGINICASLAIEKHSHRIETNNQLQNSLQNIHLYLKDKNNIYLEDKKINNKISRLIKLHQDTMVLAWNKNGKILLSDSNFKTLSPPKNIKTEYKHLQHYPWSSKIIAEPSQQRFLMISTKISATNNSRTDHNQENTILIMLGSLPVLGLLIWLIVSRGLAPLNKITHTISNRAPTQLTPVKTNNIPTEIKPLILELNSMFERLSEILEREKRFASDAAHELRTPLAILSTQTQIALRAETDEERYNALERIVAGVKRSGHIIHQLLTLSRMVPQASVEEPTIFSINETAMEMVSELVPEALTKNIEIELDAKQDAYIKGNNIAISILLRNLIDNAVRYSPCDGLVIVSIQTQAKNNKNLLIVRDTGPGIPEELRERVFERFFRALGSKASGSGLGLGIVKQIVKLHRGKITLNTPQDPAGDPKASKGLEIIIEFPAQKPPATSNK